LKGAKEGREARRNNQGVQLLVEGDVWKDSRLRNRDESLVRNERSQRPFLTISKKNKTTEEEKKRGAEPSAGTRGGKNNSPRTLWLHVLARPRITRRRLRPGFSLFAQSREEERNGRVEEHGRGGEGVGRGNASGKGKTWLTTKKTAPGEKKST